GDRRVVDAASRSGLMRRGDAERLVAEIDAYDGCAGGRHRFSKDAAAASDVDDPLAGETACHPLEPVESQWIDPVQRTEHAAVGIPPVMGERGELGEFARVEIGRARGAHWCTLGVARLPRLCVTCAPAERARLRLPLLIFCVPCAPGKRGGLRMPLLCLWVTCAPAGGARRRMLIAADPATNARAMRYRLPRSATAAHRRRCARRRP